MVKNQRQTGTLEIAREKMILIHRACHYIVSRFLSRNLANQRKRDNIFKVLKETKYQSTIPKKIVLCK
jgi:hypothetical protein